MLFKGIDSGIYMPARSPKTRSLFVESSTGMVDISLILYIDKFAMNNLESNPSCHFPLI